MKNLFPATTALLTAFLLSLSLLTPSCKKQQESSTEIPEEATTYIYAYTSGIISRSSPVKVFFAQKAVEESELDKPVEEDLLSLSGVSGKPYWENTSTLVFAPDELLEPGTTYNAKLKLGKIFPKAPRSVRDIKFAFRTRDINLVVQPTGLQTPDPQDLSKQNWQGILYATDEVENEAVEKTIKAKQFGRELPIEWTHTSPTEHHFTVQNIRREEKAGEIVINIDGSPVKSKSQDKLEIAIPPLSEFSLINGRFDREPQQRIVLEFSDPLLENQNTEGLISLYNMNRKSDYSGLFRTNISGNQLYIYPGQTLTGEWKITVSAGLQNSMGKKIKEAQQVILNAEEAKPQVRISGRGVILPDSRGLILPFEVIALKAVELEIFKIYHNNVMQFLQTNSLSEDSELQRVGEIVLRKKIELRPSDGQALKNGWTRYAINLEDLIGTDRGAIYQARLGFYPGYTTLTNCDFENNKDITFLEPTDEQRKDKYGRYISFTDNWYGVYGYTQNYWSKRDNPCEAAYYNSDHFVSRNLLATNIGLIAKRSSDGSLLCVAADLLSAKPLPGVEIELYNYQQQLLEKGTTDSQGMLTLRGKSPLAHFVIARKNGQNSYLRLRDSESLSLSRFNTSGVKPQEGLKGYFYAERGVWRPGDQVYLNFILESREENFPDNMPLTFELYDARGKLQEKRVTTENQGGIYPLYFKTESSAPTGTWTAKVRVGGASFRKSLRIETIKPNRLKVELDFKKLHDDFLSGKDEPHDISISSRWLHGAPASGLRAVVEMQLLPSQTKFEKFPSFVFNDPVRKLDRNSSAETIFEGLLDESGKASFRQTLVANDKSQPGMLRLLFNTRVFEKGGDFSANTRVLKYSPFKTYAGVEIPLNQYRSKRLDIDKEKAITFASVDENGKPQAGRQLQVEIYRVNWRWWWDDEEESLARFINDSETLSIKTATLTTDRNGLAKLPVKVSEWGRYLVRVCDTESGHCAGDFFYAGYPWYDQDGMADKSAASMLALTSNKDSYQTGEKIELNIPAAANSRLLLTLENGSGILQSKWYDLQAGSNTISFTAKPEMSPTIYAFATLIQPHAQTENDRPMRMYGLIPLRVEEPSTHLEPKLSAPEELRPNSKVKISVSEANGRPMGYTLAIVDEGLLDLTNFKTPNPWDGFYAKEGLGVKTFDLYDYVLGAYSGKISRLLSVGGDGDINPEKVKEHEANRFKPMVIQLGPFFLEKGKKATHEVEIPNYLGSVRVMVTAANPGEKAYGKADKTVPVRQELMVLATLPRVLGPGESLELPVNVFAMKDKVRKVNVSLQSNNDLIQLRGDKRQEIRFERPGEKMAYFPIRVADAVGVAKLTVIAKGDGFESRQEIEIQVRNPNPRITEYTDKVLDGPSTWRHNYSPIGVKGTNEIYLEVSTLPNIDLGKRLDYLIHYPYGCIEQTTSSGFPQLHLPEILELSDARKQEIEHNVKATIRRLKSFQRSDGHFAYWPNGSYYNPWSDIYAGHFLLEAQNKGYNIPAGMLNRWLKVQKKQARAWSPRQNELGFYRYQSDLEQAYRLYALALAQKPEMGAMNRLRNMKSLSANARLRLAAAYALAGKTKAARELINGISTEVPDYVELSGTFGSSLRDQALMLETFTLLDQNETAAKILKAMAEKLNGNYWWNTHALAQAFVSISKFVNRGAIKNNKLKFKYRVGNDSRQLVQSGKTIILLNLPDKNNSVEVENLGQGPLFLRLVSIGQPLVGKEKAQEKNLKLSVQYTDMQGKQISPQKLRQGTDFLVVVTVEHPYAGLYSQRTLRELALQEIFPSGWEITNTRMQNLSFGKESSYTYRDIRDDRVTTFFNLYHKNQLTYILRLTAAYKGRFYLPAIQAEAMYDNNITANTEGMWVEVTD